MSTGTMYNLTTKIILKEYHNLFININLIFIIVIKEIYFISEHSHISSILRLGQIYNCNKYNSRKINLRKEFVFTVVPL